MHTKDIFEKKILMKIPLNCNKHYIESTFLLHHLQNNVGVAFSSLFFGTILCAHKYT